MVTYSEFKHEHFTNFRYVEPISNDYEVFINGKEIPVYTCRISKIPFNRLWPGHQREINQSELCSFVNIVSDEKLNMEVRIKRLHKNVSIRPYSKNVEYCVNNDTVSFSLEKEGQFVLNCDDFHGCLYIFNSKPIECKKEDVTYYFGPGVHFPGKITLKDNESIYVHKDALVFGCIFADKAENIKVFGNGIFDDSNEERFCAHCYEAYVNGNAKFYDCKNVKIEGVLFRNSAVWCINIFHCFNVVIDNIKVFGQWRYNTDGIDIVNSQDILIKNSFVHSFDDSVTIKGIDRYIDTDCINIVTDNCVLWCDWGRACEVGLETACRECKDIVFKNCDILRAGHVALDIQNGDCAEVSRVVFENINVEFNSFDNLPVLQKDDESIYDGLDKSYVPELISLANYRFRSGFYCNDTWHIPKDIPYVNLEGIDVANVHDITVKNINVYYDEKIERVDGKYNVPITIKSVLDNVEFYNINISGIKINGQKLLKEDAVIAAKGIKNIKFE